MSAPPPPGRHRRERGEANPPNGCPTEVIRIIAVDDHQLLREGVKKILRGEPDMQVVGEAVDIRELFTTAAECRPQVVILDIDLPGGSGLDAIEPLRALYPGLAVIVLSMYAERRYALRAFKAGASAYISKSSAADELVDAVRKVANGGRYVNATVAELLAAALQCPETQPPHERLSARELQVLSLIGAGRTVKQIAHDLDISINTVNTHRARLMEKTGFRSNLDLVRYAVEHGLI